MEVSVSPEFMAVRDGFATRASIKALDVTLIKRAWLGEGKRRGWFSYKLGNYAAEIAADTQEGVYLKPNSDPTGATGVWVREYVEGVSIEAFGADADADDNAVALAAAWQMAGRGVPIIVPVGTFRTNLRIGTNLAMKLTAPSSTRFSFRGVGPQSVIKVNDGQIFQDFQELMQINPATSMDSIRISDLTINHNASGSAAPADQFAYQHSGTINFEGGAAGVKLRDIIVENVTFIDPPADCIQFAWAGTIEKAIVHACRELDRVRTRATVQVVRHPLNLIISDLIGHRIESELEVQAADGCVATLSNCQLNILDIGVTNTVLDAAIAANALLPRWELSGVTIAQETYLKGTIIQADATCVFTLTNQAAIYYLPAGTRFEGSTFRVYYDAGANSLFSFFPVWAAGRPCTAEFNGCRFAINSQNPAILPTGYLVDLNNFVSVDGQVDFTFRDCWFDKRAQYSIHAVQCGDVRLIDNDYGGQTSAIMYAAATARYTRLTVIGGDYRRVAGSAIACSWNAVTAGAAELRLTGDWRNVATPYSRVAGSGASIDTQIMSNRRFQMSAAPATGLIGDVVELWQKAAGTVDSYRCTVSSHTAATWKARTTLAA